MAYVRGMQAQAYTGTDDALYEVMYVHLLLFGVQAVVR